MICFSRRVLFVHIPKTGGTSVERALFPDYDWSGVGVDYDRLFGWCPRLGWLNHLTFQEILTWFPDHLKRVDRIVTIVRHPYERLVSEYSWKKLMVKDFPDFASFVEALQDYPQCTLARFYKSRIAFEQHLKPQSEYIGEIKRNLPLKLIRFESPSWAKEIECCLDLRKPLPHCNRSYHGKYQIYYNVKTKFIAKRIYHRDFKHLNYEP